MTFPADDSARAAYQSIVDGARRAGSRGNVLFCVSTDDLERGSGDLYVALGLARALSDDGWGVSLWPTPRLVEQTPDDVDVAIFMIESFVPGMVRPSTKAIAWVRNWADAWAALPYLGEFSQIWCSSRPSADLLEGVFDGPVHVVPIASDTEMFRDLGRERVPEVVTTANFWGIERDLISSLEAVASTHPVSWFGANSQHLRITSEIRHHDTIDYFRLPEVYAHWTIVVDDVIVQAAKYGNQNSRLYDALAGGAVVITNTRRGLDELGLDEVPTYTTADELAAIIDGLLADPPGTAALAARLGAHVRDAHSYRARARLVGPMLEACLAEESHPERRSPLVRWATLQRETLRALQIDADDLRSHGYALGEQLEAARAQLAGAESRAAAAEARLAQLRALPAFRAIRRLRAVAMRVRRVGR